MSIQIGFHEVKRLAIDAARVIDAERPFSTRAVTLTFADGSEFRFYLYGEACGIDVCVGARTDLEAAA